MTVAVIDTNVLIRLVLDDNQQQSDAAFEVLNSASSVVVTTPVFCEFVWVMRSIKTGAGNKSYSKKMIADSIRHFIEFDQVIIADAEVQAGLKMLDAGGDFADGVIEYTGRALARHAATTFFSFDKDAVSRLARQGVSALLLH